MYRQQFTSQTAKQHLIDHPLPGQLSKAANPLAVLREQALRHEFNRLESVAELMGMVGIMTARKVLSGHELVTVGKAIFQYGQGDRAAQIQAAHCLPGQILFDGRPVHTAEDWTPGLLERCKIKPLPLAAKLRNVCGRTDFVDQSVNQADSLIEIIQDGRGIKRSLGRSVQMLQQHLKYRPGRDWHDIGELVTQAVKNYRDLAANACEERLIKLQSFVASDPAAQRKSHVLENYLQTVQDSHVSPEICQPPGFMRLVGEVVAQEGMLHE
jgi:hypothetical protein